MNKQIALGITYNPGTNTYTYNSDGTEIDTFDMNKYWMKGQPDGQLTGEHCIVMENGHLPSHQRPHGYVEGGFNWMDVNCNTSVVRFCERAYTLHTKLYPGVVMNIEKAAICCSEVGLTLAIPKTIYENNALKNYAKNKTTALGISYKDGKWFYKHDDTEVIYKPDEFPTTNPNPSAKCAVMNSTTGKWLAKGCTDKVDAVICERVYTHVAPPTSDVRSQCLKHGQKIPEPRNQLANEALLLYIQWQIHIPNHHYKVMLGISRSAGGWIFDTDRMPVTYQLWFKQPNQTDEHCATMVNFELNPPKNHTAEGWVDDKCDRKMDMLVCEKVSPAKTACSAEIEFTCKNRECLDLTKRCDGVTDCQDDEDEKDCANYTCLPGWVKCQDNTKCAIKCDDQPSCSNTDSSDEEDCGSYTCLPGWVKCQDNTTCARRCDGQDGCTDSSDEEGCVGCGHSCEDQTCSSPLRCRHDNVQDICTSRDDTCQDEFVKKVGAAENSDNMFHYLSKLNPSSTDEKKDLVFDHLQQWKREHTQSSRVLNYRDIDAIVQFVATSCALRGEVNLVPHYEKVTKMLTKLRLLEKHLYPLSTKLNKTVPATDIWGLYNTLRSRDEEWRKSLDRTKLGDAIDNAIRKRQRPTVPADTPEDVQNPACPDGFVLMEDNQCYKIISDSKTRPEAIDACIEANSKSFLAEPMTPENNNEIKSLLDQQKQVPTVTQAWLGGTDFVEDKKWWWPKNNKEMVYNDWKDDNSSEPNCMFIQYTTDPDLADDNGWKYGNCKNETTLPSICQTPVRELVNLTLEEINDVLSGNKSLTHLEKLMKLKDLIMRLNITTITETKLENTIQQIFDQLEAKKEDPESGELDITDIIDGIKNAGGQRDLTTTRQPTATAGQTPQPTPADTAMDNNTLVIAVVSGVLVLLNIILIVYCFRARIVSCVSRLRTRLQGTATPAAAAPNAATGVKSQEVAAATVPADVEAVIVDQASRGARDSIDSEISVQSQDSARSGGSAGSAATRESGAEGSVDDNFSVDSADSGKSSSSS